MTARSFITFIIIHVILRQLLLVAFITNYMRVLLEETDQKLKLQPDPTALHQNQKGKKYMQKLASVRSNPIEELFLRPRPHIPSFKAHMANRGKAALFQTVSYSNIKQQ